MSHCATFAARLVETRPLTEDVRHFVVEVSGARKFEFAPGQHVCLTVKIGLGSEERHYSIASPPRGDNRFELCVATGDDPGGLALAGLEPGAELCCRGPDGSFALREPPRDSLFIGTGTGVAPLRSMVLSILEDPRRRDLHTALLLGARTPDRLFYHEELERLAAERENFELWPTLTRANGDWAGRRGRVLMHMADALSGRHNRTRRTSTVCGQPGDDLRGSREQLFDSRARRRGPCFTKNTK